jgi:PAS domain S-box-containing protein
MLESAFLVDSDWRGSYFKFGVGSTRDPERFFVTVSAIVPMTGFYDYSEVARSVLIAIAASYAALDLTGRVVAASGRVRVAWLSGGAIAMGIGIWAMHVKAMLALHLPVSVAYHWPTILAALLVAIFASAVALYVSSRQKMGAVEAMTGSLVMGAGIAGLHYLLMAAMRSAAITRYSPFLVACSILLAVLFSLIALLMAFDLREKTRWTIPRRLGSAIVMGTAILAMHYTGMAAARFFPGSSPDLSHTVSITPVGGSGVVIATLIVLVAAIITSSVDRRARAEIQRLNQALERRVAERTLQLEAVNESLRKEIGERQRAEEDVRRSEDRLRLVIDTLPAIVWSKLPDGSADFFNQRFREYTGLSVEEGLGWGWIRNAFHPEDRVEEEWRAAFAAGEPFEREARLKRSDGAYRWFLLCAVPLRDELGHVVKWYGTSTDIEDRRRADEALQETEHKLAQVTRRQAMGELAAAIAHEVNQPLTAIVTNANFSFRQLEGSSPNLVELRAAVTEIVNDGTRASAVISRIRGLLIKETPRWAELNINEIIQEVTTLLRNELTRNHLSLRTELATNLPRVQGDSVQLQQVLINLIMNALEAMRLSTEPPRKLLIRSAKNAGSVVVQVQDSGPGIEPGLADRIFEPFFTTKAEGIGMGLSISHSIIESHGGQFSLVSSSQGALFEFTLPVMMNE